MDGPPKLIGHSRVIRELEEEIVLTAHSDAKVLIDGESGVGKELVARLVHKKSRRNRMPLVTVNCAGIPETLLESELFGHERRSFTGASHDQAGLLVAADGGIIFFDEIGEMSPRMQATLLRFLETGELQTIGSASPRRVNVRVLCATNKDLHAETEKGGFRADLYYRLNVVRLTVAPLRERPEDVMELFDHFLGAYSENYGRGLLRMSPEVEGRLVRYSWPGNVRELRNLAEQLVVRIRKEGVEVSDLPAQILHFAEPSKRLEDESRPSRVELALTQMLVRKESFWDAIHRPFVEHDLTRDDLRRIVQKGLESTHGDHRALVSYFNMPSRDQRRFLSFLSKYDCYPSSRSGGPRLPAAERRAVESHPSSSQARKHAS